jgi:hypothetical protein
VDGAKMVAVEFANRASIAQFPDSRRNKRCFDDL